MPSTKLAEKKSRSHRSSRSSGSKIDALMEKWLEKMVGEDDNKDKPLPDRSAEQKRVKEYEEGPAAAIGEKTTEVTIGPYIFQRSKEGVCSVQLRREITSKAGDKGTIVYATDADNAYADSDVKYAQIFGIIGYAGQNQGCDAETFKKAMLYHNDLATRGNFYVGNDDYDADYIDYIHITNEISRVTKLRDEEVKRQGPKTAIAKAYEATLKDLRTKKVAIEDNKKQVEKITKTFVRNIGISQAMVRKGMLDGPIWDKKDIFNAGRLSAAAAAAEKKDE